MTYVLVHGGGSTARFWDRLLPHLASMPAPAVAVDLPGRNGRDADLATLRVEDEVASVVDDIARLAPDGPLVVVAHSSGGLVVPGVVAATGRRVVHIVLIAALVPEEGGCGLDCMKPQHRDGLVASVGRGPRAKAGRSSCPGRLRTPSRSGAPTAATRSTTTRWPSPSTPSAASPTPCTITSSPCAGRVPPGCR